MRRIHVQAVVLGLAGSLAALLPSVVAGPAAADTPATAYTYKIVYSGAISVDKAEFERVVAETYADRRGWRRAGVSFQRVPASEASTFTVVLAEATRVPRYSSECSVKFSCRVGRNVIINQNRWRWGVPHWKTGLTGYRQMVLNHETGHWLGRGHANCSGPGRAAPVMQQQSKSLQGCRPNPWPTAAEIAAVDRAH